MIMSLKQKKKIFKPRIKEAVLSSTTTYLTLGKQNIHAKEVYSYTTKVKF